MISSINASVASSVQKIADIMNQPKVLKSKSTSTKSGEISSANFHTSSSLKRKLSPASTPDKNGQRPTNFSVSRRESALNQKIKKEADVDSQTPSVLEDDDYWLQHYIDEIMIHTENKSTQTKKKYSSDDWLAIQLGRSLKQMKKQRDQFKFHLVSELEKNKIQQNVLASIYTSAHENLKFSETATTELANETDEIKNSPIKHTDSEYTDLHSELNKSNKINNLECFSAQKVVHHFEMNSISTVTDIKKCHKEITQVDQKYKKYFGPLEDTISSDSDSNRSSSDSDDLEIFNKNPENKDGPDLSSTPKAKSSFKYPINWHDRNLAKKLKKKCSIRRSTRTSIMDRKYLATRRVSIKNPPLEEFLKQEVKELEKVNSIENIEITIPNTQEMPHLTHVEIPQSTEESDRINREIQEFQENSQKFNLSIFDVSSTLEVSKHLRGNDENDTDKPSTSAYPSALSSTAEEEWKEFCRTRIDSE